jgi:hypothetical protein
VKTFNRCAVELFASALGVIVVSALSGCASWVAHDLGHVAQVVRVMAKRYRDAVGPWRAYLPTLTR